MKSISSLLICLVITTFSGLVISEETISECEKEAISAGIDSGEEFDSFVLDCEMNSNALTENEIEQDDADISEEIPEENLLGAE